MDGPALPKIEVILLCRDEKLWQWAVNVDGWPLDGGFEQTLDLADLAAARAVFFYHEDEFMPQTMR